MVDVQKRFTADASHELRTPLTAIKTEIEVGLRDEKLSLADAKKLLNSNLEEVEKLQHLSESLLKVARFENHLDKQPTNIKEVILEAYRQVEKQAKKHNIDFDFKLEDRTATIDPAQIRELMIILLDNAIKYSPSGSVVTVRSTTINQLLNIQVADNGQGIKEMDLPYIFNRFYRADHSRTKNTTNGYGLGLSIAQTIAENHKGQITVDSKVGNGTTFTVILPLTKKD
jgi:signal transduction histidine kinase